MPRPQTTGGALAPAERRAFDAIYAQHLPTIVRYLHRRLGDQAAEDAAAEVFVRALRAQPPLTSPDAALPWLYVTATHVISERRRSEKRRLRAMERAAREASSITGGPDDWSQVSPELVAALRRLPAPDREALLLVAWGELSYDETAAVLRIPVGTVRSRIARARRRLDGAAAVARPHATVTTTAGDR